MVYNRHIISRRAVMSTRKPSSEGEIKYNKKNAGKGSGGGKLKLAFLIISVYFLFVIVVTLFVDFKRPLVILNGDREITVECGSVYEDAGADAYVNGFFSGTGNRLDVNVFGTVDTSIPGSYEISYISVYHRRADTETRIVNVVDTTAPVIELYRAEGYHGDWVTGYIEEGFSAYDNVDGDITALVSRTEMDDRIIYTVTDAAGNSCTVERPVDFAIHLELIGDEVIELDASPYFTDPGFNAFDGLGNSMNEYVTVENTVIPYRAGSYTVTYTLENELGGTVIKTRTVNINAVGLPETVYPDTNTIYLTFDDGPGPYTSQLLDVLAKYDVKATFFVTGDEKNRDMIGRAYSEGHSIGVHTYSHDYYGIYYSEAAYLEDFFKIEDIIYEQTGSYTRLFRFPGGSSNTVSGFNPGIMSRLSTLMTDMGYKYFDWNVLSGDAGETELTNEVYEYVVDGVSGNSRTYSVVLQHDIKDFSVAAVEKIIVWGLNHGYTFAALDITSPGVHHGINN